ncbi:MAG: hypothetical protein GX638_14905 [Crenarchaeota archaeon]|nr:hypothetical protein [Thermoproteota archaeon]
MTVGTVVGVGVNSDEIFGASGLGSIKNGTKLTVIKVRSFFRSKIV